MISKKKHNLEIARIYEYHAAQAEKQVAYYEEQLAKEYDRARLFLADKMRALLLDFNFEVFQHDSSTLKPRVYAFISAALNEFHERAINARSTIA